MGNTKRGLTSQQPPLFIVAHMGAGKTTYASAHKSVHDIDEADPGGKVRAELKALREKAVADDDWSEHNARWYPLVKEWYAAARAAGGRVFLIHHEENASIVDPDAMSEGRVRFVLLPEEETAERVVDRDGTYEALILALHNRLSTVVSLIEHVDAVHATYYESVEDAVLGRNPQKYTVPEQ